MTGLVRYSGLKLVATTLSRRGLRARLSILNYHRVLPAHDSLRPGEPTAGEFAWQMELLCRMFTVLPLSEAVTRLKEGTLPARPACVTFDDGYADNHSLALPILQRLEIPATFFVATGFLNGGRMFNDTVIESVRRMEGRIPPLYGISASVVSLEDDAGRRQLIKDILASVKYMTLPERGDFLEQLTAHVEGELSNDLMMTDDQVQDLARSGMEVGAHTVHHPILKSLDEETAREEIALSKSQLESLLGQRVGLFAYPNGRLDQDFGLEHRNCVEQLGFDAAVTTHRGVSGRSSDPFMLPRFTPWDRTPSRFAARLLTTLCSRAGQG